MTFGTRLKSVVSRAGHAMASPGGSAAIAAASAIGTLIAAWFSYSAVTTATEVPFKQVQFEAKSRALDDYRRAAKQYELDMRVGVGSLPYSPEDPQNIWRMNDEQVRENALAARPLIDQYHNFVAASQSAGTQWSQPIHRGMIVVQKQAYRASYCFLLLGTRTRGDATTWLDVRKKSALPCAFVYTRRPFAWFQWMSYRLEKMMRDELAADALREGKVAPPGVDEEFSF